MAWNKRLKKCIFTLNIGDYAPEILKITYPFIEKYASKIGAELCRITERKFPEWPVTYEKLQIWQLAQEMENDWNIYIDSDALIHPDLMDITNHLSKDTVMHNAWDESTHRYKADRFFLRDGRFIGSCNWFTVASDLCIDVWKPLDDLTPEEALENIYPIVREGTGGITREHLIDDYALSRNIAKFGLKMTSLRKILEGKGYGPAACFIMHQYNMPEESKKDVLVTTMKTWGLIP